MFYFLPTAQQTCEYKGEPSACIKLLTRADLEIRLQHTVCIKSGAVITNLLKDSCSSSSPGPPSGGSAASSPAAACGWRGRSPTCPRTRAARGPARRAAPRPWRGCGRARSRSSRRCSGCRARRRRGPTCEPPSGSAAVAPPRRGTRQSLAIPDHIVR